MFGVAFAQAQHPARVLLLGCNHLFMQAAAELLGRYHHLSVIGRLEIGEQALARAKALRPEVVLVDLDTTNGDGLRAIPGLRGSLPEAGIIALTLAEGSAYRQAARKAGADALVVKAHLVDDLLPAIGRVSNRDHQPPSTE